MQMQGLGKFLSIIVLIVVLLIVAISAGSYFRSQVDKPVGLSFSGTMKNYVPSRDTLILKDYELTQEDAVDDRLYSVMYTAFSASKPLTVIYNGAKVSENGDMQKNAQIQRENCIKPLEVITVEMMKSTNSDPIYLAPTTELPAVIEQVDGYDVYYGSNQYFSAAALCFNSRNITGTVLVIQSELVSTSVLTHLVQFSEPYLTNLSGVVKYMQVEESSVSSHSPAGVSATNGIYDQPVKIYLPPPDLMPEEYDELTDELPSDFVQSENDYAVEYGSMDMALKPENGPWKVLYHAMKTDTEGNQNRDLETLCDQILEQDLDYIKRSNKVSDLKLIRYTAEMMPSGVESMITHHAEQDEVMINTLCFQKSNLLGLIVVVNLNLKEKIGIDFDETQQVNKTSEWFINRLK